nr:hypothetical protein [Tanacetum cinerariifolium]
DDDDDDDGVLMLIVKNFIITFCFDNNISLESNNFKQSSNSEDIVSSKGPSKALLKWYDDTKDEDIPGFMFSMSGDKIIQSPKKPTLTVIVKSPVLIKNYVLRLANIET